MCLTPLSFLPSYSPFFTFTSLIFTSLASFHFFFPLSLILFHTYSVYYINIFLLFIILHLSSPFFPQYPNCSVIFYFLSSISLSFIAFPICSTFLFHSPLYLLYCHITLNSPFLFWCSQFITYQSSNFIRSTLSFPSDDIIYSFYFDNIVLQV